MARSWPRRKSAAGMADRGGLLGGGDSPVGVVEAPEPDDPLCRQVVTHAETRRARGDSVQLYAPQDYAPQDAPRLLPKG